MGHSTHMHARMLSCFSCACKIIYLLLDWSKIIWEISYNSSCIFNFSGTCFSYTIIHTQKYIYIFTNWTIWQVYIYIYMCVCVCTGGSAVNNFPTMQETQETWVKSMGWEDPVEEGMATHSSILAWKIPWAEQPGRLQSIGSQRVRHNWSNWACVHAYVCYGPFYKAYCMVNMRFIQITLALCRRFLST